MQERVFAFLSAVRNGTAPRDPHNNNLIVYDQERGVTPIWYKFEDGTWRWTPDLRNWMSCPTLVVSGGLYAGMQPAICNKLIVFGLTRANRLGQSLPLHTAAFMQNSGVAVALLKAPQCDVNLLDDDGRTALWIAAQNGHAAVVRLLLQAPGIDLFAADCNAQTALHAAATARSSDCVALLLAASTPRLKAMMLEALPALLALRELPLLLQIAILDELLPLAPALTFHQKWSLVARVKHAHADASVAEALDIALRDRDGRTPLALAALAGNTDSVRLLTRNCTPRMLSIPDKHGKTPIIN